MTHSKSDEYVKDVYVGMLSEVFCNGATAYHAPDGEDQYKGILNMGDLALIIEFRNDGMCKVISKHGMHWTYAGFLTLDGDTMMYDEPESE